MKMKYPVSTTNWAGTNSAMSKLTECTKFHLMRLVRLGHLLAGLGNTFCAHWPIESPIGRIEMSAQNIRTIITTMTVRSISIGEHARRCINSRDRQLSTHALGR